MKKHFLFLLVFAVLVAACKKDEGFYNEFNDGQEWTDNQAGNGNEPQTNENNEDGSLTLYEVTGDAIAKIKDYEVPQSLLTYQQDYAKHQEIWDFVTRLLPLEERDKIGQFEVFHGGGEVLGYVTPVNENDLSKWRFGLAIDAAEQLDGIDFKNLFTYVAIHEYGHVLTLNDGQVMAGSEAGCNNYFPGEGCSRSNSYINRMFELGWKDIYREFDENNPEPFYEKYKDRFVTDYAATNPAEDIAEVFAFFITQENKPDASNIANQKIRLLYEFPELVDLRNKIRSTGSTVALRAGSWRENPLYGKFKICGRKGCLH
ncbi:MAG TPA: hypothetical protein ENJ95_02020 [Bacteroidetes bacterium]|nr:hypothetical protein [Bacteroidota bacterium]